MYATCSRNAGTVICSSAFTRRFVFWISSPSRLRRVSMAAYSMMTSRIRSNLSAVSSIRDETLVIA
jgi:hypothetical protein